MSKIQIKDEAEKIYNALGVKGKSILLLCPILKVLEMKYHAVDKTHAKDLITNFLKTKGQK